MRLDSAPSQWIGYRLCKMGKARDVADGAVAGGQTRRTSAHISSAIDDRYVEFEKVQGVP
jgi:hypothetical protein